MARYTIIKLMNLSPLHIGIGKTDNYDTALKSLFSDTISAALASIRALSGKDADIERFLNSFVISSAFPYYKTTYFLPKPVGEINIKVLNHEEHEYRKELKKVKYIALPLWRQLYIDKRQCVIEKTQIDGEYIVDDATKSEIISTNRIHQRVSVKGDNIDAEPFYFDWQFFNPEAGLYCLLEADGKTTNEIVELFAQLGIQGIGSDRNVGGGHFDICTDTIEIPASPNASRSLVLSHYIPTVDEVAQLDLNHSTYSISLRGGYLAGGADENTRHLHKRSIYMMVTCSCFHTTTPLKGKIVDLRPDHTDVSHPVYRSGRPLVIHI